MKKVRKGRFLYRMVASYTFMFSMILVGIFLLLFFVLVKNEREQAELNHQLLVIQPLKQVEKFIGEMDDIAYSAMGNEKLISKFSYLQQEGTNENEFTTNVLAYIETTSHLAGVNRGIAPAWRISAYNDRGDFISAGTMVDSQLVPVTMQKRRPDILMEDFQTGKRDFVLTSFGHDPWSGYYKSEYISLLRPIMNIYSRDVVGVIEVQQNISVLQEYLNTYPEGNFAVNIYDAAGNSVIKQQTEKNKVVSTAVSEKYGWRVELLENTGVEQAAKTQFIRILLLAWFLLTGVIFIVISLISRLMTKPLTTLTTEVSKINIAQPEKLEPISTKVNEILALEEAFNRVLDQLTFSMEQEKKSFLLAMQAQMNPHFLYNVLSVMNALALEEKNEEIGMICSNLSGMIRYSSSFEQSTATVEEELEHTKAYLELMKARYDDHFEYSIEVDPALKEYCLPKLVIQPICENAFTHPFADREPPYILQVKVGKEADGWSIRVADNGTGFEKKVQERVMERANHAGYENLNQMQIGGLGLVSSVLRIKMVTRQQTRCEITDQPGGGAVVTIYILEDKLVF